MRSIFSKHNVVWNVPLVIIIIVIMMVRHAAFLILGASFHPKANLEYSSEYN